MAWSSSPAEITSPATQPATLNGQPLRFSVTPAEKATTAFPVSTFRSGKFYTSLKLPVARKSQDRDLLNNRMAKSDLTARLVVMPMAAANGRKQAPARSSGRVATLTFPVSAVVVTKTK